MATFKVTAPEADYQGMVGQVQFTDGAATIDDERNPGELAYCRAAGYLVEENSEDNGPGGGQDPDEQQTQASPGVFDPGEHNAEDVLSYLDQADEAEATRVLDAETAGKDRKGISDKRAAILASKKESDQ